jgi:amino acid transporter
MAMNSVRRAASLRPNCLSFADTLAQSVALIAPASVAAITIPAAFGSAGNGTWFIFVLATIGLILVSININHFARRSASAGALYLYVAKGLGSTAGIVCGWALVLAYLFIAGCVTPVFAHFTNLMLSEFGLQVPSIVLYVICIGVAWYYAYTDIQLSVVLMLLIELLAVSFIIVLALITLAQHGFRPDTEQLTLAGATPGGMSFGMVLAILSFVGFESAATLGEEAKAPARSIPRSLIWSTAITGLFYILVAYTQVLAFRDSDVALNESASALSDIASMAGVELLGVGLYVGVAFSFLSCALACFNAGGRIAYALARQRFFPAPLGQTHTYNATPHVAVSLAAAIMLLITISMSLFGLDELTIYSYLGTIGTYGFLTAYLLVSIAAPVYLEQQGKLRQTDLIVSLLAGFFMLIPIAGSFYPVPAFPFNVFPYLFLLYLAVGVWLFSVRRKRAPYITENLKHGFEAGQSRLEA